MVAETLLSRRPPLLLSAELNRDENYYTLRIISTQDENWPNQIGPAYCDTSVKGI